MLYVTDSGQPKNGNANKAASGEGGLQKWALIGGVWTLEYDLVLGFDLVNNAIANANTPTAPGVTGLFGLTGEESSMARGCRTVRHQLRAERAVAELSLRDHRRARRHHHRRSAR